MIVLHIECMLKTNIKYYYILWSCSLYGPGAHGLLHAHPYRGISALFQKHHILWLVYDAQEDFLFGQAILGISLVVFHYMAGRVGLSYYYFYLVSDTKEGSF